MNYIIKDADKLEQDELLYTVNILTRYVSIDYPTRIRENHKRGFKTNIRYSKKIREKVIDVLVYRNLSGNFVADVEVEERPDMDIIERALN